MDKDQVLLFYSQIDNDTKQWLDSLEEMWRHWRQSDCVTSMLTAYFEGAINPYLSTLKILVNMSDFNHIKITSSLTYTAAVKFSEWISTKKQYYADYLFPEIKLAAFKLVSKQKNMQFITIISHTYEFTAHKELFVDTIKAMICDSKYKEASQYAVLLQLTSFFIDPEILLLPLVLQDKVTILDEFLQNCPDAQYALLTYLDGLLAPRIDLEETLRSYAISKNLPDIQFRIHNKTLAKFIGRVMNKYNLASDICPNLHQRQRKGALYFLVNKRYVEGNLDRDSWREMVTDAIGDNPNMQLDLVNMLANTYDELESYYFANFYKIPKQKWPYNIAYKNSHFNDIDSDASISKENDMISNYHTLSLSMNSIILIDDEKSFEMLLNNGLKGIHIVGIDMEWKPHFARKVTKLALMQIATKTNVYILDVFKMGSTHVSLWNKLALNLFKNKNILKLGFGLSQDMKVIHDSVPAFEKVKTCGPGYIDMVQLWKILICEHKFTFPFGISEDLGFKNGGLSRLVELCLGRKLDKSNQCSNWEQRPLRQNQITYAALDAYCLIEVYNVLLSECKKSRIPFRAICMEIQYKPPKKTMKTASNKAADVQCQPECNHLIGKNGQGNTHKQSLPQANAQCYPEKSVPKRNSDKRQKHIFKQSVQLENKQRQRGKCVAKNNIEKSINHAKHEKKDAHKESLQYANAQHPPEKSVVKCSSDKPKKIGKNGQEHAYREPLQPASSHRQSHKCTTKNSTDKDTNIEKEGKKQTHSESLQLEDTQSQSEKLGAKSGANKQENSEKSVQELKQRTNGNKLEGIGYDLDAKNSTLPNRASSSRSKSTPIHTWRVVCDSTLGNLSRELRMCGCDCIHFEYDQGGYMSAMLASREDRILLTRDNDYKRFLQFVPPGRCYKIIAEESDDQLREVLTNFNVIVTVQDISSRCLECNSDEFVDVSYRLMELLVYKFQVLTCGQEYKSLLDSATTASNSNNHNNVPTTEIKSNNSKKWKIITVPTRTWRLTSPYTLNAHTCRTRYNVLIQLGNIKMETLGHIKLFYVCERCGLVSWDIKQHKNRLVKHVLKDLIVNNE